MSVPPQFLDASSPWFIVYFGLLWLGITGLLAGLSGWSSLAMQWRAHTAPEGEHFRFASASIGKSLLPVGYGSCLTITVSDIGLGISILFPFRFMSPPLFIPWSQVSHVTEGRFLLSKYAVVQPNKHWSRIKLYGKVGAAVIAKSTGRTRGAA